MRKNYLKNYYDNFSRNKWEKYFNETTNSHNTNAIVFNILISQSISKIILENLLCLIISILVLVLIIINKGLIFCVSNFLNIVCIIFLIIQPILCLIYLITLIANKEKLVYTTQYINFLFFLNLSTITSSLILALCSVINTILYNNYPNNNLCAILSPGCAAILVIVVLYQILLTLNFWLNKSWVSFCANMLENKFTENKVLNYEIREGKNLASNTTTVEPQSKDVELNDLNIISEDQNSTNTSKKIKKRGQ